MAKAPSKAPGNKMTLELFPSDMDNLRVIQLKASSRHKAPVIRAVLRVYRQLIDRQREVVQKGGRLKLIAEGPDGSEQVLIDGLSMEV